MKDIHGWFDWPKLYADQVASARSGSLFVEVGTWMGKSALYIGDRIQASGKSIHLVTVDTCLGCDDYQTETAKEYGGTIAGELVRNIQEAGLLSIVTVMVTESVRAAKVFGDESVDFVFIDAAHDYESVKADLTAWWPKLKVGGKIAGHDYGWEGVGEAVHEFFGVRVPGVPLVCKLAPTCWFVAKTNRDQKRVVSV